MTNNNKITSITVVMIAILTHLLNQCAELYQCAVIFTTILFIINYQLTQTKTRKLYVFVSGMMLSLPIYALIKVDNIQVTTASLVSLGCTGCLSIYIGDILKNLFKFHIALCITLLSSVVIDSTIMTGYFLLFNVFTSKIVINFLGREMLFKVIYTVTLSVIVCLMDYLKNKRNIKLLISN